MGFKVSPGVSTQEIDLTTVVPAVASTEAAIAGLFRWGPVEERVLVDSEATLVARFGKPTNYNAETFFTAANFLSYANKLYVSRGADDTASFAATAYTGGAPTAGADNVKNSDAFATASQTFTAGVHFVARHLGEMGNSLKVSVCDSVDAYSSSVNLQGTADTSGTATIVNGSNQLVVTVVDSSDATVDTTALDALWAVGDWLTLGSQTLQITAFGGWTGTATRVQTVTLSGNYNAAADLSGVTDISRKWEFYKSVSRAPQASVYMTDRDLTAVDELHIVVTDEDGDFTGTPGTILEVWEAVSRATDGKTEAGVNNFYKDIIEASSAYVWAAHDIGVTGVATGLASLTTAIPTTLSFLLGADDQGEGTVALSALINAWDMFADATDVDVSLLLAGKSRGTTIANYLTANICEVRKDCMVFISPEYADVVNNANAMVDVIAFRNSLSTNSSYAVMDSGYKQQYDKYNDIYRFVPLNGDVAGSCARTDNDRDPWWSPAGFNRGQMKNVAKLAYNPRKAERDQLYQADVNPVMTQPGQGTVLFGDRTLLGKPSAFAHINVRRLFIVLEKAIATAANNFLFEFNDEFTRAQFRNMIEPFLRDVQGRRGIYDFTIVADGSNNTGEVIDRNEFVGEIYIKPVKSINFITLSFIATRTNVEFSEVVGVA